MTRSQKPKNDRQYNGQMKNNIRTNNDLQKTFDRKLKFEQQESH